MIVEFNEQDILASKIVTPAWYRVMIDSVMDKPSTDGQSMNTWLKGHILFNADNGSEEFKGVPTPFLWLFNSKGAWAAVGFCAALGMEPGAGKRAALTQDTLGGKQIDAFIGNGIYNNQTVNVMTGQYRVPRTEQVASL